MEKMDSFEQLRQAIENSDAYQKRLQAMKNEDEAVSALFDIADAEGIALARTDLEQKIAAAKQQGVELSDTELDSVNGGFTLIELVNWKPGTTSGF